MYNEYNSLMSGHKIVVTRIFELTKKIRNTYEVV